MTTLMRNGRDRRSENPRMCHASKERVLLIGTDQRITSGPAARAAAFRGRIHGCTRTFRGTVQFFSLASRAPSIHGTSRQFTAAHTNRSLSEPGGHCARKSSEVLSWTSHEGVCASATESGESTQSEASEGSGENIISRGPHRRSMSHSCRGELPPVI